ncbi:DUF3450 domain-containing protein [Halomonas sp. PAMB 3264]|uniref:DUF3450 domain-containing protein n=1 Tax=unclassified Halomonas TaxID=2609666 RepID=UPI00289F48F0|nr:MULTISPECIES: DUF3450 domain-containing protein [unclassified Halomonas]WNL37494.1 DUF3450 domain-containing protein [Halomonas sp. PAMB 3232]WNL40807.1 DUF3450 domain-containing protein [Halomonas sp. PAMB 3264]
MLKRPFFSSLGGWSVCVLVSTHAIASDEALDQAAQGVEAQQQQSALQQQIDAADEQTRTALEELRELERETRSLKASNAALTARLAQEAERQQTLGSALDTVSETRAALPVIEQDMTEQLTSFIENDLPFLLDERLARIENLQGASSAERIEQLLETWRVELEYGRAIDHWRGRLTLEEGSAREVDYLRVGRIGYYYLTPDGREGALWNAESGQWQPLGEHGRREVRNALRIADDQRTPELLYLPLSITAEQENPS